MHKGKGERLWSFSLFSCSFTAWLWFVSLLSGLARMDTAIGIALGTVHSRLFPPQYVQLSCLSSPLQSSIIHQHLCPPFTVVVYSWASNTHYICCYQNTLMDCKMPLTLFWTLSDESSRSCGSSILEAPRYDWGTRISALKGANLYWCGHEPVYTSWRLLLSCSELKANCKQAKQGQGIGLRSNTYLSYCLVFTSPLPGPLLPHDL